MIEDERALDILLSEPAQGGVRTVHKKGISVGGLWHVAADLGAYIGQRVRIRLDEGDAGKIFVFSEDAVFLCEAVCPERAGVSRRELAQATRKVQGEMLRKARKAIKAVSRASRHEHHRSRDTGGRGSLRRDSPPIDAGTDPCAQGGGARSPLGRGAGDEPSQQGGRRWRGCVGSDACSACRRKSSEQSKSRKSWRTL